MNSDQMVLFGYCGIGVFLLVSTLVVLIMPEESGRLKLIGMQWVMLFVSIIVYFTCKGIGLSL